MPCLPLCRGGGCNESHALGMFAAEGSILRVLAVHSPAPARQPRDHVANRRMRIPRDEQLVGRDVRPRAHAVVGLRSPTLGALLLAADRNAGSESSGGRGGLRGLSLQKVSEMESRSWRISAAVAHTPAHPGLLFV